MMEKDDTRGCVYKIGGIAGIVALLGLIFQSIQLYQTERDAIESKNADSTQIAFEQKNSQAIETQNAMLLVLFEELSSESIEEPTATYVMQEIEKFQITSTALEADVILPLAKTGQLTLSQASWMRS